MKIGRSHDVPRWHAILMALALGACAPASLLTAHGANEAPPNRMTYQGYLVDGLGVPLADSGGPKSYDVTFRIFTTDGASTPGENLWTEKQSVIVDKGYFSVLLGEGTAVGSEPRPSLSDVVKGSNASDRFVEIEVAGAGTGGANAKILPRLRLVASPYAFLATRATRLVNGEGVDLAVPASDGMVFTKPLALSLGNFLEFGLGIPGKEGSAGRIGYGYAAPHDALDIIGAGQNAAGRRIRMWAEGGLDILGPINGAEIRGTKFVGDGRDLTGVAKLNAPNVFSAPIAAPLIGTRDTRFEGDGTRLSGVAKLDEPNGFSAPITAPSIGSSSTRLEGDGTRLSGVAKLVGQNTFTDSQFVEENLWVGKKVSGKPANPSGGWGSALLFNGAPAISSTLDGENTDPLWMARFNTRFDSSELRMIIGDGNGVGDDVDALVVGTAPGSGTFAQSGITWRPKFALRTSGVLEFRPDLAGAKEQSAGQIAYQVHTSDSLDIVGAGTLSSNRKIAMIAEGGTTFWGSVKAPTVKTDKIEASSDNTYPTVDGHLFLGATDRVESSWGRALVFRGGQHNSGEDENSDPIWMCRYNLAPDKSQLRLSLGNNSDADDAFVIGSTTGVDFNIGTYTPKFRVQNNGQVEMFSNGSTANVTTFTRLDGDGGLQLSIEGGAHNGKTLTWSGASGSWAYSSDERLKKDVEKAEPVLDRVLKVQARRFHWKEEADGAPKTHGVIAQELHPLFPDLVGESKDSATGAATLNVRYGDFGLIAVQAIQEMQARHESEVGDLKAQIAELRTALKSILREGSEARGAGLAQETTATPSRR